MPVSESTTRSCVQQMPTRNRKNCAWNENQHEIQIMPTTLGFTQILQPLQTTLYHITSKNSLASQASCI